MNKKTAFLLVLSFLLINVQSDAFLSVESTLRELEALWAKRDQAVQDYIASKIAEDKTYDDLVQEIKENMNNQGVVAFLVMGLAHRSNQDIEEQLQYEKKRELAVRFFNDLNTLALIMKEQDKSNIDNMTREEYEKEVKPFLCNRLFANKTPEQIEQQVKQEMNQAQSNLMQTIIFGKAKHCDCIKDSWEEYVVKHNIEIKTN